ncbi:MULTISPECIES: MarR family winged helix-turn-helix transcriptional regulator [Leuconostoc]|nr:MULTISPECIES: MarR family transcriptional regulator [Leuconostoc]
MVSIGKNPDISLNQLAKVRKISKSAASQMTSKLVSKGIITKSRLENNAKRSALSLTNEELKVFYEHMNQQTYLENELENVINEFSTEELTKITLLMSKIEDVWDNLPWNPANTKG